MSADPSRTFEAWADDYDRYRPGYPDELFDEIATRLGVSPRARVADLGAGTGLATFEMARRGWRMTAVEPGRGMLDQLRGRAQALGIEVVAVEASAEDTGLPDASFDLVTAAQAFHWFDRPKAVEEMARIVRPGGGVALFWNVRRAEASPIVAEYEALMSRYFGSAGIGQYLQHGRAAEADATRAAFAESRHFEELTYSEPLHETTIDADGLVGMAFTASYVRRLDAPEQEHLRGELRSLLTRHGVADRPFSIPYRIDLWTARRSDR
jgi:ubiquinone/menaquinone biosynthesis C-methylase UbiE